MTQWRIDFQWRRKVETFSRARVQAMGNGVQLPLCIPRQVRTLRQVLAQQAIGVLVGAALPRAVRIGKEDLDHEPRCQALVLGHLFAPVLRQGLPQQRGHVPEFFRTALTGTPCIRPFHLGQDDQAGGPLHQRPDGRPIAGPLDQIALPVARYGTGGHFGRTLGDWRHIGNLAAAVNPPCSRPTRLARLTQSGQQCAPQRATRQHIESRVDRLGRELCVQVIRIRASEASGNLLRRAALSQLRLDILPQPGSQECARPPRLTGLGSRQCLRRAGPIGSAPRRGAGIVTAQGAGGSAQEPR
jgi:hypothetical protein